MIGCYYQTFLRCYLNTAWYRHAVEDLRSRLSKNFISYHYWGVHTECGAGHACIPLSVPCSWVTLGGGALVLWGSAFLPNDIFFLPLITRYKSNPWYPWHVRANITYDTRDKLIWNLPDFLMFFQVRTKFRTRDTPKMYHSYTVFRVSRVTFFLVNRVKNQNEPKRPKSDGRLGLLWFSTRPLADTGTDYNQEFDYGTLLELSHIPSSL